MKEIEDNPSKITDWLGDDDEREEEEFQAENKKVGPHLTPGPDAL